MHKSRSSTRLMSFWALVVGVLIGLLTAGASEPKKSSAPAPAHPAAQKPPGATGAHGPTTHSYHGPTTTGSHGPMAGGSHAITTAHRSIGAPRAGVGPRALAGRPAPAGSHELHAANGAAVRTRADGSRSDVHDPRRGMDIHHGLNGARRVSVERADHSRIVAERGGRGYVQHPYFFHGHEFGHRTYFDHGRAHDRFYGRYGWRGRYLDVYAPRYYYPYGFYSYAYAPWAVPVAYAWAPAPWYAPYAYYYAPYPVYAAPSLWLTDFVFAASLAAAYDAGRDSATAPYSASLMRQPDPAASSAAADWLLAARRAADLLVGPADATEASTTLTPEVKQMVSDEVQLLIQQESADARAASQGRDVDPAASNVVHLLEDNRPHVFLAGTDLDVVTSSGAECAISEGDVLRVASGPAPGADTVSAAILASKRGNSECAVAAIVSVSMTDLQDMHNHMRQSVDDGLSDLQNKQGQGGLPAAPESATGAKTEAPFAAGAPPPDTSAGIEIAQQASQADSAEREVVASVTSAPPSQEASGSPATITIGQTIGAVTAALGNPSRIIDLGAKKIFRYPDLKIVFMNGRVTDVQ